MEMWHIWLIAAVILFIIEVVTPAFLAACIGIGALSGALAARLGLELVPQLIFFAVGTLLSFFFIRPFVLKYLNRKDGEVKTNVDALVGRTGRVSTTIDNSKGEGRVVVDGDDWKAVNGNDGEVIKAGEQVEILKVDSIVLTVKKID